SSGTAGTTGSTTLIVGVNPAGLSAGTYYGEVTVTSTTTPDSVSVAVVLTVGANASGVGVTPTTLEPFLYQTGTVPAAGQLTQTLMLRGTGSFTATQSP